jgi:hypothetical protein
LVSPFFTSFCPAETVSAWLGALVLGEVEFFFDVALATGELLIALLVLERSADLGFEFLAALTRIRLKATPAEHAVNLVNSGDAVLSRLNKPIV